MGVTFNREYIVCDQVFRIVKEACNKAFPACHPKELDVNVIVEIQIKLLSSVDRHVRYGPEDSRQGSGRKNTAG